MSELASRACVPCHGGVPRLTSAEVAGYMPQLHADWTVVAGHHLRRAYKFPNFNGALAFVNRIGAIAEAEGHHPDIALGWGYVEIEIYTHAIDGLSESDFILAAKLDSGGADG